MSQKTLPWPLLVNQGFYIPKCLLSCVDFKNGSCHFFFSLSRSRSFDQNLSKKYAKTGNKSCVRQKQKQINRIPDLNKVVHLFVL